MTDITAMRPAEPDWSTVTAEELIAYRDAENRVRASTAARIITGEPDPGAAIGWQQVALPGRELPVRVYRPPVAGPLPLVIHVHGGAFVGTAVQSDWVNSHLAAHLPTVVVSVEHRLLDWETPLSAAADDGWDVLRHVVEHAGTWGIDPARVAVFGESCGGLISALAAVRARRTGLGLRAQVLVNPVVDVTAAAWTYDSATRYATTPTLSLPLLRFFQRLAVPEGADARALSPLYTDDPAGDLSGTAPVLVVVPTTDPIADHGRRYAERLQAAGAPVRLSEYPEAGHAFLSMPGMAPQATPARAEILDFLRESLGG
ncbi:alpha/beta hydrolase [Planomonospora parontospora subsp. parontospora]|uniref:Alpha/beta hydrolase n=2 Tax=Planomonospora parontospora TaxID=58119 RepID=A0AA37F7S0_9ACTN|nr:alpha/beta hydrolase [Planomonospora parontospora]GGK92354.1 alpha/beta hydrolase [Planomonospora parontospora]GII12136.1 alpha/beta hydrolase [Planomonospora parontospora subsp. parontospora]